MIFDLDQTNLFFKIKNTWCTRRFLYPYLGQSFRVDFSMIVGGSYLWTLYCYYFIPKFGSLFRAIVSGWRTRKWHWDSSLLDFGIFEIALRIRMGCGCEGQICPIGNFKSIYPFGWRSISCTRHICRVPHKEAGPTSLWGTRHICRVQDIQNPFG